MTYNVVAADLTAAAGELRTMTSGLSGYQLDLTNIEPDSVGHVELAAWLVAVGEQCDNAGQALRGGALGLAESLDASATYYTQADETSAQAFRSPFQDLLQPPVYGPPSPPVFGPFAPPGEGPGR